MESAPPYTSWAEEAEAREHAEAKRRGSLEERRRMEAWADASIPERHRAFAAANPDGPPGDRPQAAYRELREAVQNRETAILIGPRGTGKTAMAACALQSAATQGHSVHHVDAADLFAEFRQTFQNGPEGDSELGLMRWYSEVGLLAIDEAHDRGHTEYEDRILSRIVNKRYAATRPTILISNEIRQAVAESLGASIVSRVHEAGKVIECDWPSFREKA